MDLQLPALVPEAYVILIIVAIGVAVLYKLFKVALNVALAAVAGALLPWIARFLDLGLPITASLETSLTYAIIAAALYLGWEFLHYIYWFFRLVTWPIRVIMGVEKKRKFRQVVKEVENIRKERKRESGS